jgi:hypothetical protein
VTPLTDSEREVAAKVLAEIRMWQHGESQCMTASERAICHVTMHNLINMVFDHDEAARGAPHD